MQLTYSSILCLSCLLHRAHCKCHACPAMCAAPAAAAAASRWWNCWKILNEWDAKSEADCEMGRIRRRRRRRNGQSTGKMASVAWNRFALSIAANPQASVANDPGKSMSKIRWIRGAFVVAVVVVVRARFGRRKEVGKGGLRCRQSKSMRCIVLPITPCPPSPSSSSSRSCPPPLRSFFKAGLHVFVRPQSTDLDTTQWASYYGRHPPSESNRRRLSRPTRPSKATRRAEDEHVHHATKRWSLTVFANGVSRTNDDDDDDTDATVDGDDDESNHQNFKADQTVLHLPHPCHLSWSHRFAGSRCLPLSPARLRPVLAISSQTQAVDCVAEMIILVDGDVRRATDHNCQSLFVFVFGARPIKMAALVTSIDQSLFGSSTKLYTFFCYIRFGVFSCVG